MLLIISLTRRNIDRVQKAFAYPAIPEEDDLEESFSSTSALIPNKTEVYTTVYEVKGSHDDPIKNYVEHRNHAIYAMAFVDADVFTANIDNIIDVSNESTEEILIKPLVGVYSTQLVDEVMALSAGVTFDFEQWARDNQGKSLNEIHKSLMTKVKEERSQRREPRPIPLADRAKITSINDARRYMFENSARERVWTKAGTQAIPPEILEMNVPDVLRWLRDWKDGVWENKISRDDYGLKRCPDCGMLDRKVDEHHCFVVKSKQLEYKGGIPLRKHVQVSTRGDKIVTVTKKQMDLQQALANYQKTRKGLGLVAEDEEYDADGQQPKGEIPFFEASNPMLNDMSSEVQQPTSSTRPNPALRVHTKNNDEMDDTMAYLARVGRLRDAAITSACSINQDINRVVTSRVPTPTRKEKPQSDPFCHQLPAAKPAMK